MPALVAGALVALPATAQAATITVGADCSFAAALESANADVASGGCPAGNEADTIVLPAGVFTGVFTVEDDLTIVGAGSAATTIDGQQQGTVITVAAGVSVTIQGVTITGGRGAQGTPGAEGAVSSSGRPGDPGGPGTAGGVQNFGDLLLDSVVVTSNTGGAGGPGGRGGRAGGQGQGGSGGQGGRGGGGGVDSTGSLELLASSVTGNTGGPGGSSGANGDPNSESRFVGGRVGQVGGPGGAGALTNLGRLTTDGASAVRSNTGGVGGGGGRGGDGSFGPCGGFQNTDQCRGSGGAGGTGGTGGPGGVLIGAGTATDSAGSVFTDNAGGPGGLGGSGGFGLANGSAGQPGVAGPADILKGGQSLSWTTAPPSSADTDTSFDVTAASTAGLPTAVTTSGQCTGTGSGSGTGSVTVATAATVGACTVTANAAADDFYLAASQLSAAVSVTDPSPPVIGSTVTGTLGQNGWYVGDVSLVWTVSEPQSAGSLTTIGCVDQVLSADQAATAYTCGASSVGGVAQTQSVTVKIDKTAPTVTGAVSPDPVLEGLLATAGASVTDGGSGVVSAAASCGPVDSSQVGTFAVTCSGVDLAGNVTHQPISYAVVSAADSIGLLIDEVVAAAPRQLRTPLRAKLDNAQRQRLAGNDAAALASLDAFVNQVNAQRGKKLSRGDADDLLAFADQVIASIRATPSSG